MPPLPRSRHRVTRRCSPLPG